MVLESKQKFYHWPLIAVITYFIALFLIATGIAALIAVAELAFFAFSLKAISDMNMSGSILKGLGVLGLVAFLGLWGIGEIGGGIELSIHSSTGIIGISLFYLGILTIMLAAFTYYTLKYRRETTYKEKEIERAAYLKRKGELEAEKEHQE